MLFAGFNVADGRVHAAARSRSSASLANVVGLVDRLRGRLLRARRPHREARPQAPHQAAHLQWADRWFERYGDATVFFTRMLPIVRTFISLPAGVARMPFWRFTLFTFAGLPAVGLRADVHRQAGRRQLGGVEGQPALRRLRGRGDDRRSASPTCRPPAPRRAAGRAGRDAAGAAAELALRTRSRSARCTGPAELLPVSSSGAHRRSCRGCSAGPTPTSTPSCARRSRSRCTPGPPRRCSSGCATRSARRARLRPPPRDAGRLLVRCRRPSSGWRSSARSSAGWARRGRSPPGCWRGALAMAVADRAAAAARTREDAGAVDALALGLAQACALVPGVSRNGMTLAAARGARLRAARTPTRLSRHVALPIIVGATALKGTRLAGAGCRAGDGGRSPPAPARLRLDAGLDRGSSAQVERDRSLAPYAAYRARSPRRPDPPAAASGAMTRRLRRRRGRHRRRPTGRSTRSSACCARSTTGRAVARRCLRSGHYASVLSVAPEPRHRDVAPTASARRSSSPSRPGGWTRSASTASR